jgi:pimeloyl-ACP methyl ester carboxylesterase
MKLPPVVIVPDLRDGAAAWRRVANLVQHFASDVVAVELAGDALADDVQRLAATLAASPEPPVVIAHGYGALVATIATTRRNASQLIFVAGYMLDYGETLYDVIGGPATPLATSRVESVGWRAVATTYVICSGDRRIAPAVQRQLALTRATTIVELEAGEHPARSHAEALTQILHEDLVAVRGGQLHAALELVKTA